MIYESSGALVVHINPYFMASVLLLSGLGVKRKDSEVEKK